MTSPDWLIISGFSIGIVLLHRVTMQPGEKKWTTIMMMIKNESEIII